MRLLAPLVAAAAVAAGCSHARPVPAAVSQKRLPFLADGSTTAEEVILKLGGPAAQFEGERILTYRLAVTGDEVVPVAPCLPPSGRGDPRLAAWREGEMWSLVLVFDDRRVLVRHSLIRVR